MFRWIILFTCLPLFTWGQSFDLNRRKGGTYFFSQYFDQYNRPLHGTFAGIEESTMVTRIFDYGILIKETRETNGFTSHLYLRENSQSPTASYRIWHNPKQLNEFWQFTLDDKKHLRIEISVFQENGFPLIHQHFYPLDSTEHKHYHGNPEIAEKIDPLGYTNTWMPIGVYEEWNEKGILTLRKEYQDTIINLPEEQRRKGKYIENYSDGSVKVLGQYDDYGHNTGEWISFHENGNIAKTISYVYPNSYYLIEEMVEFNNNKIKTLEITLDGKGGGFESRWNDNGKLAYQRKIRNYNWDNRTSWERWYYENGRLQRYVNNDQPKDTVECKYYSNGGLWYLHLEKENNSIQVEYYFDQKKKWEMNRDKISSIELYTEWNEKGDTIWFEEIKGSDRWIKEFENGGLTQKYFRNQNGINGEFWEKNQNHWISYTYKNGIRIIETLPIEKNYPNNEEKFKEMKIPFYSELQGFSEVKELINLDNKDKHFILIHYNSLDSLMQLNRITHDNIFIIGARSHNYTIFQFQTTFNSRAQIIFYDNGYFEFYNRKTKWTDIQLWREQFDFKWN